jgi:hypothetical protein
MHPDDIKRANQLTRAYKKMEDALFDRIKDQLRLCDVCQEPVAKYEDLTTVVQSQKVEISLSKLNPPIGGKCEQAIVTISEEKAS